VHPEPAAGSPPTNLDMAEGTCRKCPQNTRSRRRTLANTLGPLVVRLTFSLIASCTRMVSEETRLTISPVLVSVSAHRGQNTWVRQQAPTACTGSQSTEKNGRFRKEGGAQVMQGVFQADPMLNQLEKTYFNREKDILRWNILKVLYCQKIFQAGPYVLLVGPNWINQLG
jgi:hypothetical protein